MSEPAAPYVPPAEVWLRWEWMRWRVQTGRLSEACEVSAAPLPDEVVTAIDPRRGESHGDFSC